MHQRAVTQQHHQGAVGPLVEARAPVEPRQTQVAVHLQVVAVVLDRGEHTHRAHLTAHQ